MDSTELILKYKKLLDEGVISQEDFNLKLEELLKAPEVSQDSDGSNQENNAENVPEGSAPEKKNLIKCVKCGEEYSTALDTCPHCGFKPDIFVCPECESLCRKYDKACFRCGNPLKPEILFPATKEQIKSAVIDAVNKMPEAQTLKDWERILYPLELLEPYHDAKEQLGLSRQKVQELREIEAKEQEYQRLVADADNAKTQATLAIVLQKLEAFADHEGAQEIIDANFQKWQEMAYAEAANQKKPADAKNLFDKLGDFKDAKERSKQCELQEKQRKAKIKKFSIIGGSVAAAIIIILLVANMYIIPKGHYEDGLKAYSEKNYSEAIESFTQAKGFKDSDEQIVTCAYEGGQAALEAKKYKAGAKFFKTAGEYKDAVKLRAYCRGMVAKNNGNYEKAHDFFIAADGIKNSNKLAQRMSDTLDFLEAEKYYKEGKLQTAQSYYKDLPKDFKHNGVSVKARLNTLEKYSAYVDMLDSWDDVDGYMEVRQTHDSTGIWENWYADDPGGELEISSCKILKSGKVKIEGSASFWIYTEYSSLQYIVQEGQVYKTVPFTKIVSHMPNGLKIGDDTKLTISGNTANVNYYNYSPNESVHFTYLYKTDMTFKQ